MKCRNTKIWLVLFIALLSVIATDLIASKRAALFDHQSASNPFRVGEELHYKISWGMIPAGHGTVKIPDHEGDQGVYHIVTTARSNAFVDTFYKVRNRIETVLDLNNDCSLGYKKTQREGGHSRDVDLIFDHENKHATLVRNGKVRRTLEVPASVHDPLSAIYYLRTITDWNEEPVLNVTDGKKNFEVKIRILGRETVETPVGFFKTIKIEPTVEDMEIIFDKKEDGRLYIWLTDDARKIPVKMQSELAIGSIQVILAEARVLPPAN